MILEYNPHMKLYVLQGVESDKERVRLTKEYGLDWSLATGDLYTPQPYCAATFIDYATPEARGRLDWIGQEVEASRRAVSDSHFDVPEGLQLWPYQKADLEYMLRREHSLDADEPGLGKTPTAIVLANEMQAQRVLVVCPASIRFQWVRRILEWSTMGKSYAVPDRMVYAITTAKGGVHPRAAWTVVSYELARSSGVLGALRKGRYDLLILDECHYLKTYDAKRSRAVFGGGHDPLYHEALAACAGRVVGLSGTPLPNRPREAYNLARHLCHESIDYMSEERFNSRFNPVDLIRGKRDDGTEFTYKNEHSGRHAELQNRLRANFMTRHLKRDVLTQLHYPVYELVRVEETHAVKTALRAESLLGIDPETLSGADATVLGHIAEARRLMGEAMAPQVAGYAKVLVSGGVAKLVIFYWHISVGAILEKALGSLGVTRVDGHTGAQRKDQLVQKFIDDPTQHVLIGNMLSLGVGTDGLQAVSAYAIIAEPDWTPANNVQPIDRLNRIGQTRTVQADIMVAPGSIAEKVLASALRKLNITNNALDRRV